MNLVEVNNLTDQRADEKMIQNLSLAFMEYYRLENRVLSVALVDQAEMAKLNHGWRGKTGATDVLSFSGDGQELGEIVLCPEIIIQQAASAGYSYSEEFIFILIHGLLHLIGHDDDTEEKRIAMMALGWEIMGKIAKPANVIH